MNEAHSCSRQALSCSRQALNCSQHTNTRAHEIQTHTGSRHTHMGQHEQRQEATGAGPRSPVQRAVVGWSLAGQSGLTAGLTLAGQSSLTSGGQRRQQNDGVDLVVGVGGGARTTFETHQASPTAGIVTPSETHTLPSPADPTYTPPPIAAAAATAGVIGGQSRLAPGRRESGSGPGSGPEILLTRSKPEASNSTMTNIPVMRSEEARGDSGITNAEAITRLPPRSAARRKAVRDAVQRLSALTTAPQPPDSVRQSGCEEGQGEAMMAPGGLTTDSTSGHVGDLNSGKVGASHDASTLHLASQLPLRLRHVTSYSRPGGTGGGDLNAPEPVQQYPYDPGNANSFTGVNPMVNPFTPVNPPGPGSVPLAGLVASASDTPGVLRRRLHLPALDNVSPVTSPDSAARPTPAQALLVYPARPLSVSLSLSHTHTLCRVIAIVCPACSISLSPTYLSFMYFSC